VGTVEKTVGEILVLAQQTEQDVLGFDLRRAELIRLVTGEENHAARFFGISFKHAQTLANTGKYRQTLANTGEHS
jgi:hypothetical protein